MKIKTGSSSYEDMCTKLPIVDIFHNDKKRRRRRRRRETLVTEPLVEEGFNQNRSDSAFFNALQPTINQQAMI